MELIKGAPVSAKIKEEVGAMLEKINGPAPVSYTHLTLPTN